MDVGHALVDGDGETIKGVTEAIKAAGFEAEITSVTRAEAGAVPTVQAYQPPLRMDTGIEPLPTGPTPFIEEK